MDLLTTVQATPWLFLMGSIALLIVLGSILEGLPRFFILAPLLLPIASDMGISQLHFGIVLLIAMAIGAFTPPVGARILHFLCRAGHHGGAVLEGHGALFRHLCIGVVLVAWSHGSLLCCPGRSVSSSDQPSATREQRNFDSWLRAISLLRVHLQLKAKGGQPPRLHTLAVGLTAYPNS